MISVIIPAYNSEAYLKACLESVSSQSFSDIEIIVIDDGSTDRTAQIASDYAATDNRVRVISQPNSGSSVAKNTGIDLAKGEAITFVDSDDMLMPGALETLKKVMDKSKCGIAVGGFSRRLSPRPVCSSPMAILESKVAIEKLLYQTDIASLNCSPCGKLYRKEIFESLRFRQGIRYEDLDLICPLFDRAKTIGETSAPVYYYRPNPDSFIKNFSSQRLDVLQVVKRIEEHMAENHTDLLPAAHDRRLSANFDIYCLLSKVGGYDDIASECWETIKRYRRESFFNPKVRMKNKLGIIASCFGKGIVKFLAKYYKRSSL